MADCLENGIMEKVLKEKKIRERKLTHVSNDFGKDPGGETTLVVTREIEGRS